MPQRSVGLRARAPLDSLLFLPNDHLILFNINYKVHFIRTDYRLQNITVVVYA